MRESAGERFVKMTGSGNDFVFVDARRASAAALESPEWIRRACARGTGIGADGAVFLDPTAGEQGLVADLAFGIRYYNADGSRAALCGNASLCSARLAVEWQLAPAAGFRFGTDSGVLSARIRDGRPEIDLEPVRDVRPSMPDIALDAGERRAGFALVGVPHLVIQVDDVADIDVERRGAELRRHPAVGAAGANVNFVSREATGSDWLIRTFERGVEGETLACGTGTVATALLLGSWGETGESGEPSAVHLRTRSGAVLSVRAAPVDGGWAPSLAGEGRIVFAGELREL